MSMIIYCQCLVVQAMLAIEGLRGKRGEVPFGKLSDLLVSFKLNFHIVFCFCNFSK